MVTERCGILWLHSSLCSKKPKWAKPDQLLQIQIQHDTCWQCWGEMWKRNHLFCMLVLVQKKWKFSGRNHSFLWVSWWSSWSADHAPIDNLCDFNYCIRTCLWFAVFPPKLFLHKVNMMLMLSLLFLSVWFSWAGYMGFIYSHVSINIISVKWIALILASALVTHAPYRYNCCADHQNVIWVWKKYLVTKQRDSFYMTFVSNSISVWRMVWYQKVSWQILDLWLRSRSKNLCTD